MYTQIPVLSFLLFLSSVFSCQQNQDMILRSVPENVLQVKANPISSDTAKTTTSDIIFQSVDGGQTWQDVSDGLPKDLAIGPVFADSREVILASENALYHSSAAVEGPIWDKALVFGWDNAVAMEMSIAGIFYGRTGPYISSSPNGLFQNVSGTGLLSPVHNTLQEQMVRCVWETPDGTVFVGSRSGIFKSTDGTQSWKQVYAEAGVFSLVGEDSVMICGTDKGLLRSSDCGEHWNWVLTEDGPAFKTGFMGGRFVTVTEGATEWKEHPANRLRVSADAGKTWQRMDKSLSSAQFLKNKVPIQSINDIKQAGKYLFCSCDAGIFRSADWGKSWEPVFAKNGMEKLQLAVSGNVIYAVKVSGC